MAEHRLLVDEELHVPGYVQATDPGVVGAGKLWVDTSLGAGLWNIKIRNAADTDWESITVLSTTGIAIWNPDSASYVNWRCRNNPDGDPELYPT